MTERGVSEVLGFVLVFAVITGSIAIVYTAGLPALARSQDAEKVDNVERAFDVLADNVEDLQRSGVPSRATEVKLAGGSLDVGDPVSFDVRAEQSTDSNVNASFSFNVQPIVYEDEGGTEIVYSNGAVIRAQTGGSVMLAEPGWVTGENRSVVQFVLTHGSGGGIGGDGAVLVVVEGETRSLQDPFAVTGGATAEVNVTVTSPRVESWQRYFEDEGYLAIDADTDHDNVTYQFETDTLYVHRTSAEVTFNR